MRIEQSEKSSGKEVSRKRKKKNPKWEKVHTSISDMSEFEKIEDMIKANIAKK